MLKLRNFITVIIVSIIVNNKLQAQLGFCTGNSGDAIFTENFGQGADTSLPAGTTTYTYANGVRPDDGFYIVTSNSVYFDWFNIDDHTPNDSNGRMLIVNSDITAGEFYRTNISGLCENTTYEFSSWLLNLTPSNGFCATQGGGAIPINVRFEIWDNTDTSLLASGSTGDIASTASPIWDQYALVFQTLPGQTSIILKMINNGQGGCGNDLAIDDIEFKSCGDSVIVADNFNNNSVNLCSTLAPFSATITATPDFTVFNTHFYQWQQSNDGVIWNDVIGETNQTISISASTTTYYRVKVAESPVNLNNPLCILFSDEYQVTINQAPNMPTLECWETATFNDNTCMWEVSGTQPVEPTGLECWEVTTFNNTNCVWEITGTQPSPPVLECWESATFNNTNCAWEVSGSQPQMPSIECWEIATFNNTSCSWEVSGNQPQAPNLECWETTTFNNTSCVWDITGTQPEQPSIECWETATFNNTTCAWEVTGIQPPPPMVSCNEEAVFNNISCTWEINQISIEPIQEDLLFCGNEMILLSADIDNATYLWSTGETSRDIIVTQTGMYSVDIIDSQGCIFQKVITLNNYGLPVIGSVVSDGTSIIVNTVNSGNYEYSIDGIGYQLSNIFNGVEGDYYTIYVRSVYGCQPNQLQYLHFVIPKVMTPNGDSYNDTFSLKGIESYQSSEVYIFNRYGKLLKSSKNTTFAWDGTFNNEKLPNDDYWYFIKIEGQEFKGHFTLKR